MATMSVRIEDNIRDQLEERAEGEGVSVSELIRQAIESLLEHETRVRLSWSAPSSLPMRDRLQLSLLHQIVQMISTDEDEVAYHDQMVEVLQSGYTGEYGNAFNAIDEELPLSDCKLLWDILDMFRVIEASVERIGIENLPEASELGVTFSGFDHNDPLEAKMALYAMHLVENGKWQELAVHFDREHEYGNSHAPMLDVYKRMLEVYRPIWSDLVEGALRGRDGFHLTAEEVAHIIRARRYPR